MLRTALLLCETAAGSITPVISAAAGDGGDGIEKTLVVDPRHRADRLPAGRGRSARPPGLPPLTRRQDRQGGCAQRRLRGAERLAPRIRRPEPDHHRHRRCGRPAGGNLANALGHLLVRLQDLEFRVASSAIQETRALTRTVGLGGNGQFSRLSALDTVTDGAGPWRGALLEDYELSLHLMLAGHRNEYTQDTYVDQEGLPGIRQLVRQRTRWGQGTMQCGRYLRRLWTSPHVSTIGALEATYYLFQPWMQVAGTLIYPVPAAVFLANYAAGPAQMRAWALGGGWMLILLYCAFGLGPFVCMGPLYRRRCEPELGVARCLGLGLAYSAYILIFYVTSWRALSRILRHRREWTKTPRTAAARPALQVHARPVPVGGIQVITEIMGGQS